MIRSIARARSALMSRVGRLIVSHHRSALPCAAPFGIMGSPLLLLEPDAGHLSARQAKQLVGLYAIRQPFDGDASVRDCPNRGPGQAVGVRGDENRSGTRSLLEAGGDVRGQADRAVIATQIAADRPDDHFAGGDADTNPDLAGAGLRERITSDRVLH